MITSDDTLKHNGFSLKNSESRSLTHGSSKIHDSDQNHSQSSQIENGKNYSESYKKNTNDSGAYESDCCLGLPKGGLYKHNGEYHGLCSTCEEQSQFHWDEDAREMAVDNLFQDIFKRWGDFF